MGHNYWAQGFYSPCSATRESVRLSRKKERWSDPTSFSFFFFFRCFWSHNRDSETVRWGGWVPQWNTAAAAAKSLQWRLTLCDPIDGSPSGSAFPGILQARALEWAAISFCNAWKRKVTLKSLGRVRLLAIPWNAAYQGTPSMGFSGKSTGVGCHCLFCFVH